MCSFILVAPNRWRCQEHVRDVWGGSDPPSADCDVLPEVVRFVHRNGRFYRTPSGIEITDPETVERCRAMVPRNCCGR